MGDEEFQKRLADIFRVEAREHVTAMQACLDGFAAGETTHLASELERVFREAHSLKGAARAVDARPIERVCQELESRFSELRRASLLPAGALLEALQNAVDLISSLLEGGEPDDAQYERTIAELKRAGHSGLSETPPVDSKDDTPESSDEPGALPVTEMGKPQKIETTRASTAELDRLFNRTEELFSACLAQEEVLKRVSNLQDALRRQRAALATARFGSRTARPGGTVSTTDTDEIRDRMAEQVTTLESIEADCGGALQLMRLNYRQLRASATDLLDGITRLQMLPVRTVLDNLPRAARSLAKDCGKSVSVELRGDEVRIDKRILENLGDPLLHLIRNSIDHGIEPPDERRAAGKAEVGALAIEVAPISAGTVVIRITDDGRGIRAEEVIGRAVTSGIIEPDQSSLSEKDAFNLLFRSGFSTSPIVTNLSGRGLGLAIVQEKVEALEGSVRCQSTPGKGTTFSLTLPISLATTRVIEVEAEGSRYLIPTSFVVRTLRVHPKSLRTVGGKPILESEGRPLPFALLRDILQVGATMPDREVWTVAVLRAGDAEAAIAVESIVAERETIVKSLDSQLVRVPHVSGGSLGAAGVVTLVLNAWDLVASAGKGVGLSSADGQDTAQKTPARVLVVDDSVTSRSLLRDIFVGAGYRVETAVDGMEAFTRLREEEFDLVVSDVDMPRLNGFELVRRVRSDARLSEMPVVLVTSLNSREDRERGIEVGANAYIVKTRFDQSNLLEVAGRFV